MPSKAMDNNKRYNKIAKSLRSELEKMPHQTVKEVKFPKTVRTYSSNR